MRKPMATARRVALFDRDTRWRLSTAAIEILFDTVETLAEGSRQGDRWFGSTMATFRLERAASLFRELPDASTARRVADLLVQDARVAARLKAFAVADAAERAGAPLGNPQVELRARS